MDVLYHFRRRRIRLDISVPGEPPLAHVTRWRMQKPAQMPRRDGYRAATRAVAAR